MWRGLALLFLLPSLAPGGEITEAIIVLERLSSALPGDVPESGPPLFALLKDGQLFRGGTGRVLSGKLEGKEVSDLQKEVARVRKLSGLGSVVTLGPGSLKLRLTLREGHRLEILASGDPAAAPSAMRPLGALLVELSSYDHPSLRPFAPTSYLLRAKEGGLPGGCRPWIFPASLPEILAVPRVVPSSWGQGWPTGAQPASVCAGDKTYTVTLRPLLPGEHQ